jgi:glucoamylase
MSSCRKSASFRCEGKLGDYRLYALLSPHIANCGMGNTGWAGEFKAIPMMFASRLDCALALACSVALAEDVGGICGNLRRVAGPV